MQQAITWARVEPELRCYMVSLDNNELTDIKFKYATYLYQQAGNVDSQLVLSLLWPHSQNDNSNIQHLKQKNRNSTVYNTIQKLHSQKVIWHIQISFQRFINKICVILLKWYFTHFREKHNNSSYLYVQGKWREINHMSGAQIIPINYVNILAADALALCISRSSAAMALTT